MNRQTQRFRTGRIVAGVIAVSLLYNLAGHADAQPDVSQLLKQFDELYESEGTTSQMEITIVKPRKTRTMRLRTWAKGEDHALIVIEAPSRDAGMATLKVGKNLWNWT